MLETNPACRGSLVGHVKLPGKTLIANNIDDMAPSVAEADAILARFADVDVVADAREHGFREAVRHRDEPFGDYGRKTSAV